MTDQKINDDNYLAEAAAFAKRTGKAVTLTNRRGALCRGEACTHDTDALNAWHRYYKENAPSRAKMMRKAIDERGYWTVPSRTPWEFDPAGSARMAS